MTKAFDMTRFACTTIAVGRNATEDGSVIIAHTNDDISDERFIRVPAANFGRDEQRPVYYDDAALGPQKFNNDELYNATALRRYIGSSRGPGYNTGDFPPSKALGSIPQVEHTHAYFDSSYGVMNEHHLMIGECTCGAKVHPLPEPGKRIFYAAELSRIALERCMNAKEAVQLMGLLIGKYGYYGTGETLLVGDKKEAWVMEMCGYDMDGTDGLWVAQRVPDDGFFVAANQFRIREVQKDTPDMMCSGNLHDVCQRLGWWNPNDGPLDWAATVSHGEYCHPYYSLRRVWRAQSLAAPSLNLSPWVEDGYTKTYPFAVKPDQKLNVSAINAIFRDQYEGTEFDLTKGVAAGPFGNPTRFDVNADHGDTFNLNEYQPSGAWERPLSIFRCGMFWINQAREKQPDALAGRCWLGLGRPSISTLLPLYSAAPELPTQLGVMSLLEFDRNSAWWAFGNLSNLAGLSYGNMITDIRKHQRETEGNTFQSVRQNEEVVAALIGRGQTQEALQALCQFSQDMTMQITKAWWALSESLIVKYNSGCRTTGPDDVMTALGYPRQWLGYVGYYAGPVGYAKPEEHFDCTERAKTETRRETKRNDR